MNVEIPRGDWDSLGPCWIPMEYEGKPKRPLIKCQCGERTNIGLHHVHADGTVTASYFHSADRKFIDHGKEYEHEPGCGWHVFLKLKDYDQGEFPPVP
jgi:hypothetical protein